MSQIFRSLVRFKKWMTTSTMQTFALLACTCSTFVGVTRGNEEWHLVFQAVTGGTTSAYDLYIGKDTSLVTKVDAVNGLRKNHFKSDIINVWERMNIKEVEVEIHKDGISKAFFIFNATGSTKTGWFSSNRLLNTSYTDVRIMQTNFFGIAGDANITRHFMIYGKYDSHCLGDIGWIMVTEKQQKRCQYEEFQLAKSVVIFSPKKTATIFNSELPRNSTVADSMNIYVKFDSEKKSVCTPDKTISTNSGKKPSDYTTTIQVTGPVDTSRTSLFTSHGHTNKHKNDATTIGFKQVVDIKDEVEKLKQILTVDKKSTNKHKRTLISSYDNRTTAVAMGTVGALLISMVIGLIVIGDVITFIKSFQKKIEPNK